MATAKKAIKAAASLIFPWGRKEFHPPRQALAGEMVAQAGFAPAALAAQAPLLSRPLRRGGRGEGRGPAEIITLP